MSKPSWFMSAIINIAFFHLSEYLKEILHKLGKTKDLIDEITRCKANVLMWAEQLKSTFRETIWKICKYAQY